MKTQRRRSSPGIQHTTIRDFGGGWNAVDTELNLNSRFSPVFDNVVRASDGSIQPRYGWERWIDCKTGAVTSGAQSVTYTTVNTNPIVVVNWTGHPFNSGDHITITGAVTTNGITAAEINRTHGVVKVSANAFSFATRVAATSSGTTGSVTLNWTRDTHAMGGNGVDGYYYNGSLVVVTSIGEVLRITENKVITRIWSHAVADSLGGSPLPWRWCTNAVFDVFGGKLIIGNGIDKPLKIDFDAGVQCNYLVDPGVGGGSNQYVPVFDLVKSAFNYLVVHDTARTPTDYRSQIRITDKRTDAVFSDTVPAPGIAVDVDISKIVSNADITIKALSMIRDKLVVIMRNSSLLMELGILVTVGSAQVHEPAPTDVMAQHGTVSQRTVVEIGSDIFMLDDNGVPSVRLSAVSNTIVPERVSQFIYPPLSAHIGRLSENALATQTFAVFDAKNRYIHFYLPKYDDADVRTAARDPFTYDTELFNTNQMILYVKDHGFELGDVLRIAGSGNVGCVLAVDINGDRTVLGVLNKNYVLISIGAAITIQEVVTSGGSSVTVQPLNNESYGYIYHYVPQLRINAWSRFKGMKFAWGASTLQGRVFCGNAGEIWRYGSRDEPVFGDNLGKFDVTWIDNTTYTVGTRVRDVVSGIVYLCQETHLSTGATFQAARDANSIRWVEYEGDQINWDWELPWADFDQRNITKVLRTVSIDAAGEAKFTAEAYVDNIYKSRSTGIRTPVRTMQFVAADAGGFGSGEQPFGGGRRTKEQKIWYMPTRFKLLKLAFRGSTNKPLQMIAISFGYHKGNNSR